MAAVLVSNTNVSDVLKTESYLLDFEFTAPTNPRPKT